MPRRPRSNSSSSDSGSDSSDSIDNKVIPSEAWIRKLPIYSVNENPKVMSKSSSVLSRLFVVLAKSRRHRLNRTWKVWEKFWSRIWLSSRYEFCRIFFTSSLSAVYYWNFDMCRFSNAGEDDNLFHLGWVAQLTRRQVWWGFPPPCFQGAWRNAHFWALGGCTVHYSLHFRLGVILDTYDKCIFRYFYSHNLIGVHNVGILFLLVLHGQV